MTFQETKAKVKFKVTCQMNSQLTEDSDRETQSFNITLEKIMGSIEINRGGTIFNRSLPYLAYADDVNLISRNTRELNKAFITMETKPKKAGLIINESTIKYIINTINKVRCRDSNSLCIQNYNFQITTEFKYLGSLVNDSCDKDVEIRARLAAGNRCYFTFQKLLKSFLVSRNTNRTIYRSIIRPVVMSGAETWCLAANDRNSLEVWERKVLRKIYGPVCENGEWMIQTNTELMELYEELHIETEVKWMRL
jgi:hypothetical protein